MEKIVVDGGRPLKGSVKISGAKNSALPILAATLLTAEPVTLKNIPHLADIESLYKLLNHLGTAIKVGKKSVVCETRKIKSHEAPYDLVRKMRASILVLGPLLARCGKARVSLPGGCAIGARPVNLHLQALEKMGATIQIENGYIDAVCSQLKGTTIIFETVTVTGTENIMMAATLAKGQTILKNAAREPEISDLADLLIKMGAKISGQGTDEIIIDGVSALTGVKEHIVIPDRIEAATYMIAGAMLKSEITVTDVIPDHVQAVTEKLRECGARVEVKESEIKVTGPQKIKPVDIKTMPYPGFPTDCQAQWMALMTQAQGSCAITENIFENRFMHVPELMRLGADIRIEGATCLVRGGGELVAAPIMASDLRASACLVLAALASKGVTELHRVYHIDRGYQDIVANFKKLGAKIKRAQVKY